MPGFFYYVWISLGLCLIRWESHYNSSAVGMLNADGSKDHGLFQISDIYWCEHDRPGKACNVQCKGNLLETHFLIMVLLRLLVFIVDLLDDNLEDDMKCVKIIYNEFETYFDRGFDAWYLEHMNLYFYFTLKYLREKNPETLFFTGWRGKPDARIATT